MACVTTRKEKVGPGAASYGRCKSLFAMVALDPRALIKRRRKKQMASNQSRTGARDLRTPRLALGMGYQSKHLRPQHPLVAKGQRMTDEYAQCCFSPICERRRVMRAAISDLGESK